MTAAEIVAIRSISEIWLVLGGDPPIHGRARAFYRRGDNAYAVSLNDAKACWFDHRDNIGGGMLALIQRVLGCDRRAALRWLAEINGIPLDDHRLGPAERREYARQRAEASELAAWRGRLVDALKRERERWWEAYHAALRYILDDGLEAPLGDAAATVYEVAEVQIKVLDWRIDTLVAAPLSGLLQVFRELKRTAA